MYKKLIINTTAKVKAFQLIKTINLNNKNNNFKKALLKIPLPKQKLMPVKEVTFIRHHKI